MEYESILSLRGESAVNRRKPPMLLHHIPAKELGDVNVELQVPMEKRESFRASIFG
jgi:hypothetical protein